MNVLFGKKWIWFDLREGYKATIFMDELELELHQQKLKSIQDSKEKMIKEVQTLEARPALKEEDYLAMLPDEDKESSKALYDIKKKVDGERAMEITTLKNRIKSIDDDILQANTELAKGYAKTYQDRLKYDFIRKYKIHKTYADKNK